jgi:hypothetical protein
MSTACRGPVTAASASADTVAPGGGGAGCLRSLRSVTLFDSVSVDVVAAESVARTLVDVRVDQPSPLLELLQQRRQAGDARHDRYKQFIRLLELQLDSERVASSMLQACWCCCSSDRHDKCQAAALLATG